MNEKISIAATDSTPSLEFDMQKGIISLKGKSIPQDPTLFFQPLLKTLENYAAHPAAHTTVDIQLEYFNTPSAKYLQDIFLKLEEMQAGNGNVRINWHYDAGDHDMLQAGKDYQGIVQQLVFNFVEEQDS